MKNLHENHDKQNEEYISAKAELFTKKPGKVTNELNSLANDRLNKLSDVIASVKFTGDYVEALDTCVSFFDDVVLECAEITNRRTEIEHKIIELCRTALSKAKKRNDKQEHVTAKLIDGLNAKPSQEAAKTIAAAVMDITNPLRLGYTQYADFCEKNPLTIDKPTFDYLKTEVAVRANLINGNDRDAFEALEKLLISKIETPEKYLLASLNSYYHGLEKDAKRALEIGLAKFPNNERLISAKGVLRA
ncbi:MAG: hypothetical protein FWB80_13330 [Defluviitaleaceae bacterium]|nr:hypothetical protein [Defluviitaleaceae bacterium]